MVMVALLVASFNIYLQIDMEFTLFSDFLT